MTYLNYNVGDSAAHQTDIMYRHNLFPFKQFFKHVTKFAKKNRDKAGLVRALHAFRGSLKWHAEKRDSKEKELAVLNDQLVALGANKLVVIEAATGKTLREFVLD